MSIRKPYRTFKTLAFSAACVGSLAISVPAWAQPAPHSFQFSTQSSARGRLGAKVISISDELRAYFAAPVGRGILVDSVQPNTPAAQAGLRSGDVLIQVGQSPIHEASDIFAALHQGKEGDKVKLTVVRNKKHKSLSATLDGHRGMHWQGPQDGFRHVVPGSMLEQAFPFSRPPSYMNEQLRDLQQRVERLEAQPRPRALKRSKKKPARGPKS